MAVTWSFVGEWAIVGLVAGLVLTLSAACWLRGTWLRRHLTALTSTVVTAIAFGLIAARFSMTYELLAFSIFIAIGIQLAVIDACVRRLPRALIWPTWLAMTCVFATAVGLDSSKGPEFIRAMIGSAALLCFYLAVAIASHGGIGAGDVRMAALVGGALGWHSWSAVVEGTFYAFLITGTATTVLSIMKRKRQASTPLGPGMVVAAIVALL